MNFKAILAVLMLSFLSFGVAQAAGSPINEDFTALLGLSDKMLAAANNSDSSGFIAAADEASAAAKDQGIKGNSPTVQRVSTKFKQAKKAVKGGDFEKAKGLINEAIAEMNKPRPELHFGGGSEQRPNSLY